MRPLTPIKLSREKSGSVPLSPEEEAFFNRHSVRTDLAFEAHQVVRRAGHESVPGVYTESEELPYGTITRIHVQDDQGAAVIGKAKGRYVTIQAPGLRRRDRTLEHEVSAALAKELEAYFAHWNIPPHEAVLVIGLGNWNATPDNVGPLTVSKLLVTRHLYEYQALEEAILGRMRPVAALSPGVLGLTGIETAEIVRAVVDKVRPAAVICVDALAAMSVDRIGTTVQLSDAGISPGSGVGNQRKGLNRESLGVPVFALGVPTVIYATTIVSEAVDKILEKMDGKMDGVPGQAGPPGTASMLDPSRIVVTAQDRAALGQPPAQAPGGWIQMAARLGAAERQALFRDILGDALGPLVVTPKEVDVMVDTLSDILADGLNEALHPGISAEEARQLR